MNGHAKFFDVTIIGGGLHGAAIAADCAGRGLRTLLCHQGDLGCSNSTVGERLFHCGLQYLQRGDIARVNDSLHERAILKQRAPHLTKNTTVIIPQKPSFTSLLKTNTKAFLYNLVAGNDNKLTTTTIKNCQYAKPLANTQSGKDDQLAIQFDDLLINDSQLAIEHLLLAHEKGAIILPHSAVTKAERHNGVWDVNIVDSEEDISTLIQSQCIVNTTGSAASQVQANVLGIASRSQANNYQAAYICTEKLFNGDQSYLIETAKGELISVINHHGPYSLIGPAIFEAHQLSEASQLLLDLVNENFGCSLGAADILHQFTIETASYKESPTDMPTPFSQDYVLDFNCSDGQSPAVTLFGTCINMHRIIAENVIEQMTPYLNRKPLEPWTKSSKLPGGELPIPCMETFLLKLKDDYDWLPCDTLSRYGNLYGFRSLDLLKGCQTLADLGQEILPGLYEKEIDWLHECQWVLSADAIIWHRTQLGLKLSEQEVSQFNQWFNARYPYQSPLLRLQMRTEMNKQAS